METARPKELSIVIGVYNEAEVLDELYRRLTAALRALGRTYEIILVDDGSRDESLAIMLKLRNIDPDHIRALSFTRNFGHHIALTAGLDSAQGDVVVTMDADLQDQPEEIQKLLAKLDEGYDVVWGERETRQFKWYKNFTSWLFLWLMNSVARAEVHLNSSIFRAIRKEVANDLRQLREKARYLPGLVSWLGYRQTSVPVEHGKRFAGQTKYSIWRLLRLALSTATSFSAAPLQIATVSGMGTAALAVIAVIYIVIRKILGGYTVPGYASIMIAIFFFGALQLIVIGLMGEYISRIYREAQGRPLYLLRDLPTAQTTFQPLPLAEEFRKSRLFSALNRATVDRLIEFISRDPHLPLSNVFFWAKPWQLAAYHVREWEKNDAMVHIDHDKEGIKGVCIIQELEFDTRILGRKAVRILYVNGSGANQIIGGGPIDPLRLHSIRDLINFIMGFVGSHYYQLMDIRVSSQDLFVVRAFEKPGFHLVDMLITLGGPRKRIDDVLKRATFEWKSASLEEGTLDRIEFSPALSVHLMQIDEQEFLADLSREAFSDHVMIQDRFFLEPSILPDRASALFHEWFMNLAIKHNSGKAVVLVAALDGKPVGFLGMEPMTPFEGVTWWKDSLNAVAPSARGQGVYRALVIAALAHVQKMDGGGIITKTQSSTYRVINTWLHLGLDVIESFATFHWVNEK